MHISVVTYEALAIALALALAVPGAAFGVSAEANAYAQSSTADALAAVASGSGATAQSEKTTVQTNSQAASLVADVFSAVDKALAKEMQAALTAISYVLPYDPDLIAEIGTQESTGHSTCCPSFSCAYGDAIIDGTVHDHSYYACWMCTWPNWGEGDSSDRCLGSEEALLREAYDQIAAGKPTVIHVRGNTGEHWICLLGYVDALDPDHLTLSNFIALDPWDGALVNAGERFELHPDLCEHISSRAA